MPKIKLKIDNGMKDRLDKVADAGGILLGGRVHTAHSEQGNGKAGPGVRRVRGEHKEKARRARLSWLTGLVPEAPLKYLAFVQAKPTAGE